MTIMEDRSQTILAVTFPIRDSQNIRATVNFAVCCSVLRFSIRASEQVGSPFLMQFCCAAFVLEPCDSCDFLGF